MNRVTLPPRRTVLSIAMLLPLWMAVPLCIAVPAQQPPPEKLEGEEDLPIDGIMDDGARAFIKQHLLRNGSMVTDAIADPNADPNADPSADLNADPSADPSALQAAPQSNSVGGPQVEVKVNVQAEAHVDLLTDANEEALCAAAEQLLSTARSLQALPSNPIRRTLIESMRMEALRCLQQAMQPPGR
jgi:hypothetical protein